MDKNKKIVNRLIDRYGYYAYWVNLNKSMKCECVNPSTKEPYRDCKKCLGTGYFISVHKVFMASREGKEYESDRVESFAVTPKVIYMKGFVEVGKDDIIIDSEGIYTVYTYQHIRGKQGIQSYTKVLAPDLKLNKTHFLKLFKELINGKLPSGK